MSDLGDVGVVLAIPELSTRFCDVSTACLHAGGTANTPLHVAVGAVLFRCRVQRRFRTAPKDWRAPRTVSDDAPTSVKTLASHI